MNYYGIWTLFKRETNRFLKVYMQTVLSPVISNLLFLTVFGLSLHRSTAQVEGVSYLQFLVPGLIIMGISNNAFQNTSSSIIISKYRGLIQNLMMIPLKKGSILVAFIASAVARGSIVGIATWVSTLFFVDLPYTSVPVIIGSSILVALLFGFMGFITGIWAKEFDNIAFIQNFIITPMVFLGGVFYPLAILPEPFRTISFFNPIVYMVDLIRYGFIGVSHFPLYVGFSIVLGLLVITGGISYWIIKTGWKLQT